MKNNSDRSGIVLAVKSSLVAELPAIQNVAMVG
jgi:hypothetical protein